MKKQKYQLVVPSNKGRAVNVETPESYLSKENEAIAPKFQLPGNHPKEPGNWTRYFRESLQTLSTGTLGFFKLLCLWCAALEKKSGAIFGNLHISPKRRRWLLRSKHPRKYKKKVICRLSVHFYCVPSALDNCTSFLISIR